MCLRRVPAPDTPPTAPRGSQLDRPTAPPAPRSITPILAPRRSRPGWSPLLCLGSFGARTVAKCQFFCSFFDAPQLGGSRWVRNWTAIGYGTRYTRCATTPPSLPFPPIICHNIYKSNNIYMSTPQQHTRSLYSSARKTRSAWLRVTEPRGWSLGAMELGIRGGARRLRTEPYGACAP